MSKVQLNVKLGFQHTSSFFMEMEEFQDYDRIILKCTKNLFQAKSIVWIFVVCDLYWLEIVSYEIY